MPASVQAWWGSRRMWWATCCNNSIVVLFFGLWYGHSSCCNLKFVKWWNQALNVFLSKSNATSSHNTVNNKYKPGELAGECDRIPAVTIPLLLSSLVLLTGNVGWIGMLTIMSATIPHSSVPLYWIFMLYCRIPHCQNGIWVFFKFKWDNK